MRSLLLAQPEAASLQVKQAQFSEPFLGVLQPLSCLGGFSAYLPLYSKYDLIKCMKMLCNFSYASVNFLEVLWVEK